MLHTGSHSAVLDCNVAFPVKGANNRLIGQLCVMYFTAMACYIPRCSTGNCTVCFRLYPHAPTICCLLSLSMYYKCHEALTAPVSRANTKCAGVSSHAEDNLRCSSCQQTTGRGGPFQAGQSREGTSPQQWLKPQSVRCALGASSSFYHTYMHT